eukprot:s196_g1.t1
MYQLSGNPRLKPWSNVCRCPVLTMGAWWACILPRRARYVRWLLQPWLLEETQWSYVEGFYAEWLSRITMSPAAQLPLCRNLALGRMPKLCHRTKTEEENSDFLVPMYECLCHRWDVAPGESDRASELSSRSSVMNRSEGDSRDNGADGELEREPDQSSNGTTLESQAMGSTGNIGDGNDRIAHLMEDARSSLKSYGCPDVSATCVEEGGDYEETKVIRAQIDSLDAVERPSSSKFPSQSRIKIQQAMAILVAVVAVVAALPAVTGFPSSIWEGTPVDSVRWSPDGAVLVSGSEDYLVKIWNASTGKCLKTLEGHTDDVWSVAYSPDGKQIASCSDDLSVRIWDAENGKCLKTLLGHTDSVRKVVYSPDSKTLASCAWDHSVKIWDASTGQCLQTLKGHKNDVWTVAYSPNGKDIASGSADRSIKIWDLATGECLRTLKGHKDYLRSVVYSPDGKYLLSGSDDRTIKVWNASTGECLQTLKGHTDYIWEVAYSPDGKRIASGSWDESIKIWDAATGKCLKTLTGHTDVIDSVAYSPDGKRLASGSDDFSIRMWDPDAEADTVPSSGKPAKEFPQKKTGRKFVETLV